jgi:hypothetical protein
MTAPSLAGWPVTAAAQRSDRPRTRYLGDRPRPVRGNAGQIVVGAPMGVPGAVTVLTKMSLAHKQIIIYNKRLEQELEIHIPCISGGGCMY